jgi:branched-chain amino acid transport system substrate-binding protein
MRFAVERRVVPVLGAVLVLVAVVGCGRLFPGGAAASSTPDVVIGVLTPLSGPDSAVGNERSRGAELAAEIVNGAHTDIGVPLAAGSGLPRLGGARVSLHVADSAGTAEEIGVKTERLVARVNPVALVVADSDPVVSAVSQRAERLRLPLVDAASATGSFTETGLDWYFRTAPSDRILGEAIFALVADQAVRGAPARRVAVLQPADGRYVDLASVVGDLVVESNAAVSVGVHYESSARGVATAARKATGPKPDVAVVIAATPGEAVALVRGLRVRAPKIAVVGLGPGFSGPGFVAAAGKSAEGVLRAEAWSGEFADRNAVARAVGELYERRFGMAMTAAAASAFTAVLTLASAIDAARARSPESVRSALVAVDVPGAALVMPWSGVQFDRGGQNTRAAGVVEQVVGGRPRVVHPEELATEALRWPIARTAGTGR